MVFIRVFRIAISAETFIAGIVIMPHRPSAPVASTLDAEVIVALARQLTVSGTALQQPLGQRDAGRYLMTLHLLHGKGSILFDILIVAGFRRCACTVVMEIKRNAMIAVSLKIRFMLKMLSSAQKSVKN